MNTHKDKGITDKIDDLEKRISELERNQNINITIANPPPTVQIPERCPYCLLPKGQCRGHYIA